MASSGVAVNATPPFCASGGIVLPSISRTSPYKMALASGARLGLYEILASIGAGGMDEVYRARDQRLQRDVAIEVLPDLFAADPERLARFEREAQVLASLNHPHIAAIYGLEEAQGVRALVLELVEGHTLAERIAAGGPKDPPLRTEGVF
jgi:serine/threonine protein kinase